MAKRTKSQPNDIASSTDGPKPAGRGRSRATAQPDAVTPEHMAEAADSADATLRADPGSATAPQRREPSEQLPSSGEDNVRRSTSMGSEPSEEDIRMRAYHLYLERGAEAGQHEDDWLRAERELKKRA